MDSGVLMALSASKKAELKLDIIVDNLANISTIGYKNNKKTFGQIIDEYIVKNNISGTSVSPDLPNQITSSNNSQFNLEKPSTDFTSGKLIYTANPFDVAITEGGFFKIQTPEGIRYTRNGHFSMDEMGRLVTNDGSPVLGDSGEIEIKGKDLGIAEDGTIKINGASVGRISVVNFKNLAELERAGNKFYLPSGKEDNELQLDNPKLNQGYLELSNVNVVEEMVKMMGDLRANESYQKVIQNFDSIDLKAANEIGKF